MPATCRSCDAPVIWAYTENDKRIPLDILTVDPFTVGSFTIVGGVALSGKAAAERISLTRAISETRAREELAEGNWRLSHFATCPQGPQHRKGRGL